MSKERSLVRASDIGSWAFCHRAWWLATVKGVPHRHPQRLKQGQTTHHQHGQTVQRSSRWEWWGKRIILVGILLLILALLWGALA